MTGKTTHVNWFPLTCYCKWCPLTDIETLLQLILIDWQDYTYKLMPIDWHWHAVTIDAHWLALTCYFKLCPLIDIDTPWSWCPLSDSDTILKLIPMDWHEYTNKLMPIDWHWHATKINSHYWHWCNLKLMLIDRLLKWISITDTCHSSYLYRRV